MFFTLIEMSLHAQDSLLFDSNPPYKVRKIKEI